MGARTSGLITSPIFILGAFAPIKASSWVPGISHIIMMEETAIQEAVYNSFE